MVELVDFFTTKWTYFAWKFQHVPGRNIGIIHSIVKLQPRQITNMEKIWTEKVACSVYRCSKLKKKLQLSNECSNRDLNSGRSTWNRTKHHAPPIQTICHRKKKKKIFDPVESRFAIYFQPILLKNSQEGSLLNFLEFSNKSEYGQSVHLSNAREELYPRTHLVDLDDQPRRRFATTFNFSQVSYFRQQSTAVFCFNMNLKFFNDTFLSYF